MAKYVFVREGSYPKDPEVIEKLRNGEELELAEGEEIEVVRFEVGEEFDYAGADPRVIATLEDNDCIGPAPEEPAQGEAPAEPAPAKRRRASPN